MMGMGRKRPLLAAFLALLYPGLGHLYLRRWLRSLLWFALSAGAVFVLIPPATVDPGAGFFATFDAVSAAVSELSLQNQLLLLSMTALQMLDAYLLALEGDKPAAEDTCPSCGKELDEEVSFCPWCSHDLEPDAENEQPTTP